MHLRIWVTAVAAIGVAFGALAVAALVAWPTVTLQPVDAALARVDLPGFSGTVTRIVVRTSAGARVRVTLSDGRMWPQGRLATGERLDITVTVTRPGWAGWLVGRSTVRSFSITTPSARLESAWLQPAAGSEVALPFSSPVAVVSLAGGRRRELARPVRVVPTGQRASGAHRSGTIEVAAAPRLWETLPAPVTVSWFAHGAGDQLLASPLPSATYNPSAPITLTFSQPVGSLLGSRLPAVSPRNAGSWQTVNTHTLRFIPDDRVLGLGRQLTMTFPRTLLLANTPSVRRVRTLHWSVPLGTTLRLQQLLAGLGYLPLRWQPQGANVATTKSAELAAAIVAPAGHFSWRYANTPGSLQALWAPGLITTMTRAAIMMFEQRNGLAVDGVAGPEVWRTMIADTLAGSHRELRYDYIYVHRAVPEALHLWVNGETIFSSPANTGVAAAPTALGSYTVFEHIAVGTMKGINPDGSHYDDPGIRWISYFDRGEAIHTFYRASYGTPQSLGCVELPPTAAAHVWPYTPIGTLVTILP